MVGVQSHSLKDGYLCTSGIDSQGKLGEKSRDTFRKRLRELSVYDKSSGKVRVKENQNDNKK